MTSSKSKSELCHSEASDLGDCVRARQRRVRMGYTPEGERHFQVIWLPTENYVGIWTLGMGELKFFTDQLKKRRCIGINP